MSTEAGGDDETTKKTSYSSFWRKPTAFLLDEADDCEIV